MTESDRIKKLKQQRDNLIKALQEEEARRALAVGKAAKLESAFILVKLAVREFEEVQHNVSSLRP